jgi:hypothetical protein
LIDGLNIVPQAVRSAAATLIQKQVGVPVSPLRRSEDGCVELCAAAALVLATAKSPTERDILISRFEADGPQAVIDAFGELGWSKELGSRVLLTNDAFDEDVRKRGVLALLSVDDAPRADGPRPSKA